jgi:formamidopyrimidine-DNA glycosylase
MTGNILERPSAAPEIAHTHAVFTVRDKQGRTKFLHFVDPRRFGKIACLKGKAWDEHELFADLGPEPLELTGAELGRHLYAVSRGKKQPVKTFLMDARNVVGVGNIYASEALFRAGISPRRRAGAVTRGGYDALAAAVRETLAASIAAGGTTFRDFRSADGSPGYYAVLLNVYDRGGEPCKTCGQKIRQLRQGGRSTFYCAFCQS